MAEREAQPQATMHPARRQQSQCEALCAALPKAGGDTRVVCRQSVVLEGVAGADEVPDQRQGQHQAKHDAQSVQWRHPKRASFVHREQRERDMQRCGAVQEHGARPAMPQAHRGTQPGFGGVERDQPQRVAAEMESHIGEENQPRSQAQIAAADQPPDRWKCEDRHADEGCGFVPRPCREPATQNANLSVGVCYGSGLRMSVVFVGCEGRI